MVIPHAYHQWYIAAVAQWGEWKPITECGATCGPRGLRVEQRSCYVNGQKTDSSACEGEDEMVRRCAAPDCRKHT